MCESGKKFSTIRQGIREYNIGKAVLCCDKISWCIPVNIKSVSQTSFYFMDEKVAWEEGFLNKEEMFQQMKQYYPDFTKNDNITIVEWELIKE